MSFFIPQAVITVATALHLEEMLDICNVTKPQAVITVATAPLETLAWSGSLGTLWQTKSTFTIIHLKNAFFNVFPQRPALKTLITQGLHKFGKPPQSLCLHTLQKRTTLKLQKARLRDVKIASSKHVRQTAALRCPLHLHYTARIFSSSRRKTGTQKKGATCVAALRPSRRVLPCRQEGYPFWPAPGARP